MKDTLFENIDSETTIHEFKIKTGIKNFLILKLLKLWVVNN